MTDAEKIVELKNALAWLLDECITSTTEFPCVDSEHDAVANAAHVLDRVRMGNEYTILPHKDWVIVSSTEVDEETGQHLYWSNGDGWVDYENAQHFTELEKDLLNLPISGEWADLAVIS
jgi:hypothetical protein